jgi:hypothetical protein
MHPVHTYKHKVAPVLSFNWDPRHEGVLGSGGIASHILVLSTKWRWVVSFTPRPPYFQEKISMYLLYRRLFGSQSRCGRGGEEKNSQPLPGLEPSIIQPVAQRYTPELPRFQTYTNTTSHHQNLVSNTLMNFHHTCVHSVMFSTWNIPNIRQQGGKSFQYWVLDLQFSSQHSIILPTELSQK